MAAAHIKERGGAGGPGCWAFVDLAGQFDDVVGQDAIPDDWLWQREREGGGLAGGRVGAHHRHATVLLRLDTDLCINVLREVAEQTEPFTVTPKKVTLARVDRLSLEFGEEVFSLGITLWSPQLVAFKKRFLDTLNERLAAEASAGGVEGELPAICTLNDLIDHHNPYNSPDGGHASIAYLQGGDPRIIAAAKTMQDETNQKLAAHDSPTVKVYSLSVKRRGGQSEVIQLGNYIPLEDRAISLNSLNHFVATHAGEIDEVMTTHEVVQRFIVPETRRLSSSYAASCAVAAKTAAAAADTPTKDKDNDGSKAAWVSSPIGRVDFFTSHAWGYPFLDLVAAIRAHSARHIAETSPSKPQLYYWLDVFAVNQHNLHSQAELPKLNDAIASAKAVVVILTPWERPLALTRIWCLFEMPPNQQVSFVAELARDFSTIRNRLSQIDSANAQATQQADLRQIRKQIEATVGYNALNVLIKDQIRSWLLENVLTRVENDVALLKSRSASVGTGAVESTVDDVALCGWVHTMALFLGEFGRLDQAHDLYSAVLSARCTMFGKQSPSTVAVAIDLAFLLGKTGRSEDAETLLREQVALLEASLAQLNADGVKEMDGHLLPAESSGALWRKARESTAAAEATVGTPGSDVAKLKSMLSLTQNNLAMVIGSQSSDRHSQALGLYRVVLAQRNELNGGDGSNPDSISTTNNMAWLLGRMGQHEEAEVLFTRVLDFRRKRNGETDPGTLNALQNLGTTLMKLGKVEEAAALLEESVKGKLENVGLGHPSTLRTIATLAECLCLCGRTGAAQVWADTASAQDKVPRGVLDRLESLGLVVDVAEKRPS